MKSNYHDIRAEWKVEKLAKYAPLFLVFLVVLYVLSGYGA